MWAITLFKVGSTRVPFTQESVGPFCVALTLLILPLCVQCKYWFKTTKAKKQ